MSTLDMMWQEIQDATERQVRSVLQEMVDTPVTESAAYKAAYEGTLAALREAGLVPVASEDTTPPTP